MAVVPFDVERARTLITRYEGRYARVYRDPRGIPTIGIGFNLTRGDARARLQALGLDYQKVLDGQQTLTDAQIDSLFADDLDAALNAARDPNRIRVFDSLTDARKFVIVDMIFNLGVGGFDGFVRMKAAVNAEDYGEAARQMQDSDWYRQVGQRARDDVARMNTGQWLPGDG